MPSCKSGLPLAPARAAWHDNSEITTPASTVFMGGTSPLSPTVLPLQVRTLPAIFIPCQVLPPPPPSPPPPGEGGLRFWRKGVAYVVTRQESA